MRDIERNAGVEVKFPVIADLDQKVSQAYGLVHEAASDTATVRAVFAIHPKQNIRAIVYYPMQLGRNVDELIRIFAALQTIDVMAFRSPLTGILEILSSCQHRLRWKTRASARTAAEQG